MRRSGKKPKTITFKYLSLWKEPPIHGFTHFSIYNNFHIYKYISSKVLDAAWNMHASFGTFEPYFPHLTHLPLTKMFDIIYRFATLPLEFSIFDHATKFARPIYSFSQRYYYYYSFPWVKSKNSKNLRQD